MNNIIKFKEVMSSFASGIAVITTLDQRNNLYGITVNSFNSVSLDPLFILFNINKKTLNLARYLECKSFTVNALSEKQRDLANYFATRKQFNDFSDYQIINNSAILNGSIFYLECEIYQRIDVGDHYVIIGKVKKMSDLTKQNPLIYYSHNYHMIGEKI